MTKAFLSNWKQLSNFFWLQASAYMRNILQRSEITTDNPRETVLLKVVVNWFLLYPGNFDL